MRFEILVLSNLGATIAESRHWKLVTVTKSGCSPINIGSASINTTRGIEACGQWRNLAITAIQKMRPDVVIISSSSLYPQHKGPILIDAPEWGLARHICRCRKARCCCKTHQGHSPRRLRRHLLLGTVGMERPCQLPLVDSSECVEFRYLSGRGACCSQYCKCQDHRHV